MFKQLKASVLAVMAFLMAVMAVPAQAAIDAGVTTALDGAADDVKVVGLAVFVIAIGIALYKWFKRAL